VGLIDARFILIRIWVDIDNAPQVQYLLPFERVLRAAGVDVLITARDNGPTRALLSQREASFHLVGTGFGASKLAKLGGTVRRAQALSSLVRKLEVNALLAASRSSALAAARLRIPAFIILDYEHASLALYRITRSTLLYPDVIDSARLVARGVRREQLRPFNGLKEDISFAGVDLARTAPHAFPGIRDERLVRVLFRPPAERSHYYERESLGLALASLAYVAREPSTVLIFVPRHPWQRGYLERFDWRNEPVVLDEPVPFVALMKAVDLVICSGGTMLREAAYMGRPAYTILKSPLGDVDRHLAKLGRIRVISGADDLCQIDFRKAPPLSPLKANPHLVEQIASLVIDRAHS
jgi:uncharacterized protein